MLTTGADNIDKEAEDLLPDHQSAHRIRIEPRKGWVPINLRELWEYRELFYFVTWRNLKVRYKQTVLGVLWAVIQPLSTMVVFSIVFGKLADIPYDGPSYSVSCYAALLPWNLFASGINMAAVSLVASSHLVSRVYFPRIVLPTAAVLTGVVDFAIAFTVLIGMMAWFVVVPTANIVWLPAFCLLAVACSLGIGLWLAAINVYYRDVPYILPFLTQIWMFATPVAYPASLLDERWRTLYGLNPMVGVVEGFRWSLLGTETAPGAMAVVSAVVAIVILVTGAYVFRRMEKKFADMI